MQNNELGSDNKVQVILIRHGESLYNKQAQILRQKLGIGPTWEQYKKNPQFMQFKYSEQMMDCCLSDKGIKQCEKISGTIDYQNVDLILVSPLFRALQSCDIIFKDRKKATETKKIIVDPIFSESMRCTCDISLNLFKAKEQFSDFDYSLINGKQGKWYLQNQPLKKQQIYNKVIEDAKAQTYEERAKAINKYLSETYNYEDPYDLIFRLKEARSKLKQYAIEKKCKKIVIIMHFYSIIYLTSIKFDDKGKPIPYPFISNATPMKYSMDLSQDSLSEQFLTPNEK